MTEFDRIFEKYYPIVYKFTLSLCRDASLAEEITQDAFVKALEHFAQFDRKCRLYVWLCQIAKNTYYSYLRKQKHLVLEDQIPPQWADSPEEIAFEKETAARLWVLLDRLPEPYREVFSLRVFSDLSFSQIGNIYGKTDSWARLIYYRAKKRIQEDLDE